ncbi:Ig-like domain-containing protein [Candidatus Albibeggiatoa sp. nov. NOAA]|uniref:beta strand repeat-containing protein n=1 Tax=Candidatus Albibeggiatoa sp. nov. NOAA TaxID=3162724 RepID=UPI0032FB8B80|nr:Ig-like domain-containing protein [Thiotrichaceae bacterium]
MVVRILTGWLMLLILTACVGGGGGASTTPTEEETVQANVDKVVLLIQDNDQLADGQATVTLTAIARDSNNNPIPNVPVSFTSQSDSAILTPFSGTTNAQGVLSTAITNTLVESFLVSASAGNKTSEFVTVNFIEGIEVSKITLLVNNNNQLVDNGTPITLTAIARNNDNLPIPNVPIDFISSSDSTILSPFTGTTNEQGILTTSITSNIAQTFRVLARSGAVQSPEVSISFTDGNTDVARITLLVSDNNQLANGQNAINLTAIARDEANTPISNITLGFNSNSETAIFSQFSGQTNAQGLVTTAVTNTVPEVLDVYAQAGTIRSDVVQLSFVNNVTDDRVDTINLTVSNNFQRADGTSTVLLDVTARDSQGDLIPNVQINLSPSSNTAIFATLSGATNESGHFTTTVTNTLAETFSVTPTAGGVRGQAQDVTFIAPADSLVLSADTTTLAANQNANVTLTLYQGESDPTPLAGANFSVQVTGSADTSNVPQATDATGQARFQVSNSRAENVTLTVTSGQFEQRLNLYFGANLTLLPSESNAVNNATLSAILKDANQAAIIGQPINFSFVGNNNETLNINQALTGNDGVASVTVNDVQSDGGQVTVKATSGAIEAQANVNFNAAFGENRNLALTSSSRLLSSNDTAIVIARVTDSNGLPVSGQVIEFSGDNANISPRRQQTNEDGEASTRITADGNVQITASADTAQQTVPLYFGASIRLIPESANGTADGTTATTMTAVVTDNNGAAIQGTSVNFQITEGTGFLQGSPAVTNENGRAEVGLISTSSDPITLQATTGNLTSNRSQVDFFATGINPNVTSVEVIVSNSPQTADGQGQIQVTAIVRDANNLALSGIPVNFVSESNTAFFNALSGVTAENGRFSSTVTNNVVEEFTVTANAGGTSSAPVTLVFNSLAVNSIALQTSETVLSLQDEATITVTLFNNVEGNQQALPNTPFSATVSGNATLNNLPERTDSNGQARFTVTNNTIENVTLTVAGGTVFQTIDLYFGASLVLLPNTNDSVTGETVLTALLKDGNNTPLDNETVRFSFSASNNETLSPTEAQTNNQGIATVTVTDVDNDGGSALVQAFRGSLTAQAQVNFTAQLLNGSRLLISAPDQVIPVNRSADVVAQTINELGQPIQNQFITFAAITQDNNIININVDPEFASTNNLGRATTSVSSSQAQNINVTAQASDVSQTIPVYFGAKLTLSPLQTSVAADAELSAPIVATVTDTFNAPIPNIQVLFNYYFDANEDEKFTDDELQNTLTALTNGQGQATMNIQSTEQGRGQVIVKAGLLDDISASIEFTALPPQRILLTAAKEELDLTEQTQIVATVVDKYGNPIQGENVTFSVNTGTVGNEAISAENGQATVSYVAGTQAGTAIVTAQISETINNVINLNIRSGEAGAIEVSTIEPRELGVLGSGTAQTTTIEFLVKDDAGNPVDGRTVQFSLGDTGLNGGESLVFNSAISSNGVVSTILRTGVVSGTVDVIASVEGSNATAIARVPIVSNTPDARHLSLSAEFFNIAGGVQFGLEDTVTAFVGDRYGNVVASDTSVSFISEGGLIGQSVGQAFTATTELGRATAILQSAAPTTPNLGGSPYVSSTGGYQCSAPYSLISSTVSQSVCGNPGFITVIAYTTGSESYTDLNGNGQYDANEPFEDLTEPYIDGNDNGQFDTNEIYVDVDQNGQFSTGNGQFESNTTIWTSAQFLFSAQAILPSISFSDGQPIPSSGFSIQNNSSQRFLVSGIENLSMSDVYGNALVAGSNIKIEATGGVLGGVIEFEITDFVGRGLPAFDFTLSSEPPDEDGTFPPRKDVVITLTLTSGDTNTNSAPGGNGNGVRSISGSINE